MGIFEKLELNEQNLEIEFNVPTNFTSLEKIKDLNLSLETTLT